MVVEINCYTARITTLLWLELVNNIQHEHNISPFQKKKLSSAIAVIADPTANDVGYGITKTSRYHCFAFPYITYFFTYFLLIFPIFVLLSGVLSAGFHNKD